MRHHAGSHKTQLWIRQKDFHQSFLFADLGIGHDGVGRQNQVAEFDVGLLPQNITIVVVVVVVVQEGANAIKGEIQGGQFGKSRHHVP
jgi:hypothetical protein